MEQNTKVHITRLINRTTLPDKEIASLSDISETTLSNIKKGRRVNEKNIWKLINFINNYLNTEYTIDDIDGLNY